MDQRVKDIALRAKSDFYFFCKHILGYQKMRPNPHQELCDFVQKKGKRKKLVLMPRGSFKSSVVTVGHALFELVQDPNLRILIAGETQKNAKKFVGEAKTHLEGNERFKAIFGEWRSDNLWRNDEFLINRRTAVKKEASMMATSLEKQTITGQHYDRIYLDDPVSFSNVNTDAQIQKTIDYYKLLLSVLEPDGIIYIIGTRYSALDLYGWLMDELSPEAGNIEVICKEAIDDEGNLLFPEVLTREFLEEQKKAQGSFHFACQYLNRAISADTCYFNPEHVRFYEKSPNNLIYFITLDPAISGDRRSDYSAFIVNGVDSNHDWYIQEALQLRIPPGEVVQKLFELAQKYQPLMCIGMEKFMLEKALQVNILEEGRKRGMALPIKELPTDTRVSKENRIRSLQPRFEGGTIYIKKDQIALHHQILYYPLGVKNDDLLDALKSQLGVTFPAPFVSTKTDSDYPGIPNEDRRRWKADIQSLKTRKVHRKGYLI